MSVRGRASDVRDGSYSGEVSKFDWYSATIQTDYVALLDALPGPMEETYPQNGYAHRYIGRTDAGESYTVLGGGNNGASPNVCGTGSAAPGVAKMVRSLPWSHNVARADSAVDYESKGCWEGLRDFLMAFGEESRVSMTPAGDWFTEGHPKGCTLYLGSRKSAIFLRCYEKGRQLGDPISDWVRVELQVRPQRDQRLSASRASPDDLWGFGGWSRTLAPSILGGLVPNAVQSHRRESTDEWPRRFAAFVKRNRRLLWEGVDRYGDDLGAFIAQILDEDL